jgi:nucleoside-diphosphate-sugar epimerase
LLRRSSILVTGASGYIGARLVTRARDIGFRVIAAARHPSRLSVPSDVEVRAFDLGLPIDAALLNGVDVVVHLGAIIHEDSQPDGAVEDLNVSGTRRLLERARERGVARFLFVSSQSAAPDSPTRYGRSKWQIEQLLTSPGEIVVKPGMVTGGAPRGVYGALLKLCRRFVVLPLVNGSAPLYPVHLDDVCDGILTIAESKEEHRGVVRIAPDRPVAFADYLKMLATARLGRPIVTARLPAAPLVWANRIAARTRWLPSVQDERIVGLAALKPMRDGSSFFTQTTVSMRNVGEALAVEGHRRRLLLEGRTLLRYVLGRRLPAATARRYVKAVLNEHDSSPLSLPLVVCLCPRAMRLFEPVGGSPTTTLRRRLSIAMRIAEMTPTAAPVFHNYAGGSRITAALRLACIAVVEASLLPLRVLASLSSSRRDRRAGK